MNILNNEEKDLLNSFEHDEWESVGEVKRLEQIKSYAQATLEQDKPIILRLSSLDLKAIQIKAMKEGIPYQTLISNVLHKFATDKLREF